MSSINNELKNLEREIFEIKSILYDCIGYSQSVQRNFMVNQDIQSKTNTDIKNSILNVEENMSRIAPYMDSQRAYIGCTTVTFENVKEGITTAYCETDDGVVIPTKTEKAWDRVIVSFEPLTEPATVTISII